MRCVVAIGLTAAACGRIGFVEVQLRDDGGGDGVVPPRIHTYVVANSTFQTMAVAVAS